MKTQNYTTTFYSSIALVEYNNLMKNSFEEYLLFSLMHYYVYKEEAPIEYVPESITVALFFNSDDSKFNFDLLEKEGWSGVVNYWKANNRTKAENALQATKLFFEQELPFDWFVNFYGDDCNPEHRKCIYCGVSGRELNDGMVDLRPLEIVKVDTKGKYTKDNIAFACYTCICDMHTKTNDSYYLSVKENFHLNRKRIITKEIIELVEIPEIHQSSIGFNAAEFVYYKLSGFVPKKIRYANVDYRQLKANIIEYFQIADFQLINLQESLNKILKYENEMLIAIYGNLMLHYIEDKSVQFQDVEVLFDSTTSNSDIELIEKMILELDK